MEALRGLIAGHEEWLMERVLHYAKNYEYTKYTSTLREVWRISTAGLSSSLLSYLKISDQIPPLGPDEDFSRDPVTEFGVVEAQRHHECGITFGMFLSFLKYYRQSYLDLILEADFQPAYKERCLCLIGRLFDRLEIACYVSNETKLKRRLRQMQKMEAIGALAGGIAHDFNNILAPILGYSEMLLCDLPESSPLRKDVEQILAAAQRAKDLVKQILSFSRQAEQEIRPVRVGIIVKEALKLLRASLPSTIEIRQNIAPDSLSCNVMADPTQIHQIMMNLCTNAGYAMRQRGGLLQVDMENTELDSVFVCRHPELKPGSYLKLSVKDTGLGMEPAVRQKIFDPYFTTKEQGEGTGLGLTVVYGIVKNLGGTITFDSEPGKGSTFHVFLPKVECDIIPETEGKKPLPRGSERILLIDDELCMTEMMRQMLERLGYRVTAHTNSMDALEVFRRRPDQFDLVITDQTMPCMTGTELARECMRIRSGIPVVLCTGFSELVDEEKAPTLGIRGFVMKPVTIATIAETIRCALEGGNGAKR